MLLAAWQQAGLAQDTGTGVLCQEGTPGHIWYRYVGGHDTDALLNERHVRTSLQQLLGQELAHFLDNLDVRSPVDLVGSVLSVTGNAPRRGGEEEAVLCVSPYDNTVSAALFSAGTITIFSHAATYDAQSLCIKDWITQVNSGHRDRFVQPANVRMTSPSATGGDPHSPL